MQEVALNLTGQKTQTRPEGSNGKVTNTGLPHHSTAGHLGKNLAPSTSERKPKNTAKRDGPMGKVRSRFGTRTVTDGI